MNIANTPSIMLETPCGKAVIYKIIKSLKGNNDEFTLETHKGASIEFRVDNKVIHSDNENWITGPLVDYLLDDFDIDDDITGFIEGQGEEFKKQVLELISEAAQLGLLPMTKTLKIVNKISNKFR